MGKKTNSSKLEDISWSLPKKTPKKKILQFSTWASQTKVSNQQASGFRHLRTSLGPSSPGPNRPAPIVDPPQFCTPTAQVALHGPHDQLHIIQVVAHQGLGNLEEFHIFWFVGKFNETGGIKNLPNCSDLMWVWGVDLKYQNLTHPQKNNHVVKWAILRYTCIFFWWSKIADFEFSMGWDTSSRRFCFVCFSIAMCLHRSVSISL